MRYVCACCGRRRGRGVWMNKGLIPSGDLVCKRCLSAARSATGEKILEGLRQAVDGDFVGVRNIRIVRKGQRR